MGEDIWHLISGLVAIETFPVCVGVVIMWVQTHLVVVTGTTFRNPIDAKGLKKLFRMVGVQS